LGIKWHLVGKSGQGDNSFGNNRVKKSKRIPPVEPDSRGLPLFKPKKQLLGVFEGKRAHFTAYEPIPFAAIMRGTPALLGVHQYFQRNDFFQVHTPIITGSDAEGAGKCSGVSTLEVKKPPLTEKGEIDL